MVGSDSLCISSLRIGLKTEFKAISDILISLYYLFKKSGKVKRKFKSFGKILGVDVLVFPKVHGTRFVSHQLCGLQHLLHNWGALVQCFEHCVADSSHESLKNKLWGMLKKLKNFNFLLSCLFFKQVLSNIARLLWKIYYSFKPTIFLGRIKSKMS